MKFLIDECLSEDLAIMAQRAGHLDASHVRWLGLGGYSYILQKSLSSHAKLLYPHISACG